MKQDVELLNPYQTLARTARTLRDSLECKKAYIRFGSQKKFQMSNYYYLKVNLLTYENTDYILSAKIHKKCGEHNEKTLFFIEEHPWRHFLSDKSIVENYSEHKTGEIFQSIKISELYRIGYTQSFADYSQALIQGSEMGALRLNIDSNLWSEKAIPLAKLFSKMTRTKNTGNPMIFDSDGTIRSATFKDGQYKYEIDMPSNLEIFVHKLLEEVHQK